ncbi:FUSC family protein [Nocardia sp. CA-119907]|uniref:FUSC family protein n=1 Tax=Nocardia sp. CA-119907 TaxID=3239973 RepID=UPI003D95F6C6
MHQDEGDKLTVIRVFGAFGARAAARAVQRVLNGLWDRFCSFDPGLIRLASACTTVGGMLVTLVVLALPGASVPGLVVGALTAMTAGYAVCDTRPHDQAITLAAAAPIGVVSLTLGTVFAAHHAVAAAFMLLLVFIAVYLRRFGPRASGLGDLSYQTFFVALFVRATPQQLPQFCVVVVVALAAAGFVRFGVVRATPARTLRRLCRTFHNQLEEVVDMMVGLASIEPNDRVVARRAAALDRHVDRMHRCASIIQSHLSIGINSQAVSVLARRRVAETQVATERVAALLTQARPPRDRITRKRPTIHRASSHCTVEKRLVAPEDSSLRRLAVQLNGLRLLVSDPTYIVKPTLAESDNQLAEQRNDKASQIHGGRRLDDACRAVDELTRAVTDLYLTGGIQDRCHSRVGSQELKLAKYGVEPQLAQQPPPTFPTARTEPSGLKQPSMRAAFQVTAGSALALYCGQLLSPDHWYWAMLTCWVIYINTSSVGEILIKGYRRLAGTLSGVVAGTGLVALVAGHTWLTFILTILSLFAAFFTAAASYLLMSFFITAVIGLLYTLLGAYNDTVLVLRLEETAIGAASAMVAALLVLPTWTEQQTTEKIVEVLHCMRQLVAGATAHLGGDPQKGLLDAVREAEVALEGLRAAAQPLLHPANPLRAQRSRTCYILDALETSVYHARGLAVAAERAGTVTTTTACDPGLKTVGQRVEDNALWLEDLLSGSGGMPQPIVSRPSAATRIEHSANPVSPDCAIIARALSHLHRLDDCVTALARTLGAPTASSQPEASSALHSSTAGATSARRFSRAQR